jgi:hypothetical protein
MTERENTIESIHIQARLTDTEEKAFWQQFKQTNGLTENSETLRAIINQLRTLQSSPTLKTSMPQEIEETLEKCKKKGCPAYPYFDAETQEVLCVFPYEGKEPKIVRRSTPELKACSDAPILISMTRKRALEEDFQCRTEALTAQIDRAEEDHVDDKALVERLIERENESVTERVKNVGEIRRLAGLLKDRDTVNQQLRRQLQPMQTYITENKKLSEWRLHTANFLLRVLEERDALETDNEQQRKTIEELSHDVLVETNKELSDRLEEAKQLLKVRENAKNDLIGEYKTEIEKVQALNEVRERKTTELISETRKMLTEFKQFLPSNLIQCQQCVDGTTMREYLRNIRKQINDFEGYLETTMPTPKDNVLRGS